MDVYSTVMHVDEGRSRITRKNAAKILPLLQGLQACPTRKINYSQLFMHVTIIIIIIIIKSLFTEDDILS